MGSIVSTWVQLCTYLQPLAIVVAVLCIAFAPAYAYRLATFERVADDDQGVTLSSNNGQPLPSDVEGRAA
ncbi:hypothetical protein [Calidifontibacter indicus]|uniref:Uncharacterized protein n=1 Tax=Calidifontibacter indicus TaxID=419650 RepID=A0A3D9UMU6_9MICO|nr:hypothetical protein [Calidifontibacter indicus]REF30647.1 hypothetical protein DFJ65_1662 [Calidifontibacter indicus]